MKLRIILFASLLKLATGLQADTPALSLVIDDLGYAMEQAREVFELPGRHTYAVIPDSPYAQAVANLAIEHGKEVILHMPMQSATDLMIEASALHDAMSEREITQRVQNMIRSMPQIRGINNHMGSRLTEMGYIMRPVMETIRQNDTPLYFLDSRTTPLSTAYQQARFAGLAAASRDVFLDYDLSEASLEEQWSLWLQKARDQGHAIAIAHPHRQTVEFLRRKIATLGDRYRLIPLSERLLNSPSYEAPKWQRYLSHLQQDSKNSKQSP
jgi:hypothetical protein